MPEIQARARREVRLYLVAVFLISLALGWEIIRAGTLEGSNRIAFIMWTPGACALAAKWIFKRPWSDLALRGWKTRQSLRAYAWPALLSLLCGAVLLATRVGAQQTPEKGYAVSFLLAPTLVVAFACVTALGEEIGWRGFLHSRMKQTGWKHPAILTGLIWGFWHVPLIVFADYSTSEQPLLSVALFLGTIISFSVFLWDLREQSGSIWAPTIAHASHNVWFQAIVPSVVASGPLTPYLGGEAGLFPMFAYLALALGVARAQRGRKGAHA